MLEEHQTDDYDDIMDGSDDVEPKSDTRVSPLGEEIPESLPSADEKIIEEAKPSKTDEPEKVIEGTDETGETVNPYEQRFKELGLDRQYKEGIKELIEKAPVTNKYVTELERERNYYREQVAANRPAAEAEQELSRDDFFDNPVDVLNKAIDSKLNSVNARFNEIEVQGFINSKSDYNQMEPLMIEQLEKHPYLRELGIKSVPVLYEMAKAQQLSRLASQQKPPDTGAVTPEQKANAVTATGKKDTGPSPNDKAYWWNKSIKEIEDEFGYGPE